MSEVGVPRNLYQSPEEEQARCQAVDTVEAMIHGRLGLVEGSRRLCSLRHKLGETESPLFTPFVGFDSETDHYPIGEVRTRYAPEYLEELDRDIEDYIERSRAGILDACRDLADHLAR